MFKPVHVIAEMACSHEGDPQIAQKIIDAAGAARADAVQFQIWNLSKTVVPHHPDYGMLQRIELSPTVWTELTAYTRERHPQMQIIACVYESSSVDLCEKLEVDAYKIHSADLSNPFLINCVAKTNKRIDLSVGASTVVEIQTALDWIRHAGNDSLWLMYGYQGFPTPTDAIHLDYMAKLKSLFELPVGYQDHSAGGSDAAFWLPAAAIGMGVDILEKHITHDRAFKGIDHEAALNPDEFARFVEMVRELEVARGTATPRPFSPQEEKYRKYSKKSLVASRDLPAHHVLSAEDVTYMRGDKLGFPPDQFSNIVGRTTRHAIPAYYVISGDDLT
jgi:sialic acid synthase SpsE